MKEIPKQYACDVCGHGFKSRKTCLKHEADCKPVLYFTVPDGMEFRLATYTSGVWLKQSDHKGLNGWDSGRALPRLSPGSRYRIIGRIEPRPDGANFAVGIERINPPA